MSIKRVCPESKIIPSQPEDLLKKLSLKDLSPTPKEKDLRNLIYLTDSEEDEVSTPNCGGDGTELPVEKEYRTSPYVQPVPDTLRSSKSTPSVLSTKEKLKQLASENEILAKKVLGKPVQKKKVELPKVCSSAAVNRKKAQWSIDRTNQILYKKIQAAKPTGLSFRKGAILGRDTKLSL